MPKKPSKAMMAAAQELLGPVLVLERIRETLTQQTKVLLEMAVTLEALATALEKKNVVKQKEAAEQS
jgi:hypothetical protein